MSAGICLHKINTIVKDFFASGGGGGHLVELRDIGVSGGDEGRAGGARGVVNENRSVLTDVGEGGGGGGGFEAVGEGGCGDIVFVQIPVQ